MSHVRSSIAAARRQRVLVVDDEERIVRFVTRRLSEAGFEVTPATGGAEALRLARTGCYDLVILDLLMPDIDGVSVLRQLTAEQPGQPVIVLSCLSDPASKVRSLALGASDFVAKPFFFDELLARVRAQLRAAETRRHEPELVVGEFRLDLGRQTAIVGGKRVVLTRREFLLLRELARHPGAVSPKAHLLRAVWGLDFDPGSNVVEVYVGRLRSKLGNDVVETVRNQGYRLAVAE